MENPIRNIILRINEERFINWLTDETRINVTELTLVSSLRQSGFVEFVLAQREEANAITDFLQFVDTWE